MSQGPKPFLLLIACLLLAAGASAATPPDLYAAATPVPDQSDAARNAAFARDLAAVFVKLSGNPQASQSPALASMVANAGQWVVEFRYQPQAGNQNGGLELWAHFDDKAVDAALARSGLAVWGKERPSVLAWVLTPAGILGDDPADPVATAMHQAAQMRGLPLELPLMDLADQRQVSDFDIRTLNLADLNAAAQRYGTQAMLVGTIRALDQGVAADWNLVFGNTTTPFAGTAATPQAAAADAVGQAATLLASQLAYVPQSGGVTGKLNLVVEQVANLQAEVAVQKLIAGAQGVSSARLVAIENDTVHFEVSYTGSSADLARALTLNGSLAQDNNPVAAPATAIGAGAPQYVLYFRYTP